MSRVKSSNRSQAPTVAAWVDALREFDPGAKVLYAREGDFEIGEKSPDGAPCIHGGSGYLLSDLQKKANERAA